MKVHFDLTLDEATREKLKREARRQGISMNDFINKQIEQSLVYEFKPQQDLPDFAYIEERVLADALEFRSDEVVQVKVRWGALVGLVKQQRGNNVIERSETEDPREQ